jgi:hypothetical protein
MIYGKYMLGMDAKARQLLPSGGRCEERFEVENVQEKPAPLG